MPGARCPDGTRIGTRGPGCITRLRMRKEGRRTIGYSESYAVPPARSARPRTTALLTDAPGSKVVTHPPVIVLGATHERGR